jgi:hypothetical protein
MSSEKILDENKGGYEEVYKSEKVEKENSEKQRT